MLCNISLVCWCNIGNFLFLILFLESEKRALWNPFCLCVLFMIGMLWAFSLLQVLFVLNWFCAKLYCSAKNPVEMCLLNWDAFWALSALLRIWQCIWRAPSKLQSDIHYLSVPSIFKRTLLFFGISLLVLSAP